MTAVRIFLFNVLFYAWTLIIPIIGAPVAYLYPPSTSRWAKLWLDGVYVIERFVLGLDYRVIGWENLPQQPCLIAMKHQSAWETMKLFSLFNNPAIVMKKELMALPFWGKYTREMGMVPIDRRKGAEALSVMEERATAAITAGRHVVIFPQGTRILPGDKKPYKYGVMKLYQHLNVPLVPVAINAGLFWPKNGFWKKPGTITVEILPAITPGQPEAAVFQELQQRLETASDALLQRI